MKLNHVDLSDYYYSLNANVIFVFFRYDPSADISNDIETEQDRIIFIKSVAQFMVCALLNYLALLHIKVCTKCPPFCRWHCQMLFLEMIILSFDSIILLMFDLKVLIYMIYWHDFRIWFRFLNQWWNLQFTRDYFVYVPNQWETMLQCNIVSHWLGAYTKRSLVHWGIWS